jgi:hypothetical protein
VKAHPVVMKRRKLAERRKYRLIVFSLSSQARQIASSMAAG